MDTPVCGDHLGDMARRSHSGRSASRRQRCGRACHRVREQRRWRHHEVNSANNSVIATAPFRNNANSVAVTPDGRRLYASNRDVGEVTVFDTRTNVPVTTIAVGNGSDNLGLAVSPNGQLVYVANQNSNTVTVIYTPTNAVVQVIPTGLNPIWVTFSRDGSLAYVSNQVSGSISVIATASSTVVGTIWGFSCRLSPP